MRFLNLRSQKGQSLLEVMVALAAASMIIAAVVGAVVSALNNEKYGTSQNQATQYAQEGLDILRNSSQADWNVFMTQSGTYCLGENQPIPSPPAGSCGENIGHSIREIIIEHHRCGITPYPASPTNAQVTSIVKWSDGKCPGSNLYCHQVKLVSCFYKPS